MRKALVGLILAATVLTPIAAQAQEDYGRSPRQARGGEARTQQRQQRVEQRQERVEQRQERVEQRQEQRQQRQEQRAAAPAPVAVAQPAQQQRQQQRQEYRQQRQERATNVNREGSSYPSAWQGNPNDPARQRYERLERRNQYVHGTREQRETVRDEFRDRNRRVPSEWREDRRDQRADSRRDWRRDWNRNSWRNDRRYDWQSYRYQNRNIFRSSPYYSPYRNHRYSRFSIGFFLEPLFYGRNYWLGDPWQYRLPYAPNGTQWVRYYDDVLLVDVYSGEVIDVIYDFFW